MVKVAVIGAGLSGLASAMYLRRYGFDVIVFDRQSGPGGVAGRFEKDGFLFDTGPTWYLMPDVFEKFFKDFGIDPKIDLQLMELDPSYRIYYGENEHYDIQKDMEYNYRLFDSFEKDGAAKLRRYLSDSEYKYKTAIKEFLYLEYKSIFQFFNRKMLTEGIKLHVLKKLHSHLRKYFSSDMAAKILEYNIVFLGTSPYDAPGLYSLMSHVDMKMGVSFPKGGIYSIAKKMHEKSLEMGIKFFWNHDVRKVNIKNKQAESIEVIDLEKKRTSTYDFDIILSAVDYPHFESLIERKFRNYSTKYWQKKLYAPTAFLVYVGLKKKVPNALHHNIYTPVDWDSHFDSIFKEKEWPDNPAYYFAFPCKSDPEMCPKNRESLFLLVPVAPAIDDNESNRNKLKEKVYSHLSALLGYDIPSNLLFEKITAHKEFKQMNYYNGTSLGLAHSLFQSAAFRPRHRNKKAGNIFYTGHYTHPGIGMPMVLISSWIAAQIINEEFNEKNNR